MAYRNISTGSLVSAAIFVIAGCGNTIIVGPSGTTTGTSTGGAGGSTTTTTSVVNPVTTTASTSVNTGVTVSSTTNTSIVSTGDLPIDPCQQGCDNAQACGLGQCSPDTCNNPQDACSLSCLANANCQQIKSLQTNNPDPQLFSCIESCQGGTGGAGGAEPGTGGGGGAFPAGSTTSVSVSSSTGGTQIDCGQCLQQNKCFPQGCFQNKDCQKWGFCAYNCTNSACFDACDAQFPAAELYQQELYGCACNSCNSDCSYMDACGKLVDSGGGSSSVVGSSSTGFF